MSDFQHACAHIDAAYASTAESIDLDMYLSFISLHIIYDAQSRFPNRRVDLVFNRGEILFLTEERCDGRGGDECERRRDDARAARRRRICATVHVRVIFFERDVVRARCVGARRRG